MDTLDNEEFLDPRVKRTISILEYWESSHQDEVREQEKNAVQAISDAEIDVILDRIIPDGGLAWFLVFTTWVSNGITNGVSFCFGIMLSGIVDAIVDKASACPAKPGISGSPNAAAANVTAMECKADQSGVNLPLLTAVGTVHNSVVYLITPLILLHSNRVRRLTDFAYMGAFLATLGLFLCAMVDYKQHSGLLLLYYSLTTGLGLAIQTTLQSTILSHYFNKRMSIAAGITSSGNGMFSGLLSICISRLNSYMGVRFSFLMMSWTAAVGLLYTQLWRANRDFLLLQKWVRTPAPLMTELFTARVLHNRRYVVLFFSVLLLYSGLIYSWMIMMEYAKEKFTADEMLTITYVYTVRGFSNALLRCLVGFVLTLECVRRRLIYMVPLNQALYPLGLLTLLLGLETRSLPLMFAAAGVTALGESLVIAGMPVVVALLTNPADTPAGLVFMNLTFSLASLIAPPGLSLLSMSMGSYQPSIITCCGIQTLGCLLSVLLIVWRSEGGDNGRVAAAAAVDDSGVGGTSGSIGTRYITLEGSLTMGSSGGGGMGVGGGGSQSSESEAVLQRSQNVGPGLVNSVVAADNRSVTQRAVKYNAYRVTAWRQQECDAALQCFKGQSSRRSGVAAEPEPAALGRKFSA